MRLIKVAAAQLGPIPHSITNSINAQEVNDKIINGNLEAKSSALSELHNLDIDKIREYNIGRMKTMMEQ